MGVSAVGSIQSPKLSKPLHTGSSVTQSFRCANIDMSNGNSRHPTGMHDCHFGCIRHVSFDLPGRLCRIWLIEIFIELAPRPFFLCSYKLGPSEQLSSAFTLQLALAKAITTPRRCATGTWMALAMEDGGENASGERLLTLFA